MLHLIILQLANALFSVSTFCCCNWVLGSYNNGITQALFYAIGQTPLGIGIVLCTSVCKKLGRNKAMIGGFILAAAGTAVCLLNPVNLIIVDDCTPRRSLT